MGTTRLLDVVCRPCYSTAPTLLQAQAKERLLAQLLVQLARLAGEWQPGPDTSQSRRLALLTTRVAGAVYSDCFHPSWARLVHVDPNGHWLVRFFCGLPTACPTGLGIEDHNDLVMPAVYFLSIAASAHLFALQQDDALRGDAAAERWILLLDALGGAAAATGALLDGLAAADAGDVVIWLLPNGLALLLRLVHFARDLGGLFDSRTPTATQELAGALLAAGEVLARLAARLPELCMLGLEVLPEQLRHFGAGGAVMSCLETLQRVMHQLGASSITSIGTQSLDAVAWLTLSLSKLCHRMVQWGEAEWRAVCAALTDRPFSGWQQNQFTALL